MLRDYFGDDTIRRVFRNSRGDFIRHRVNHRRGEERGVDAMSIAVRTRTGKTLTAEEYRTRLQNERAAEAVVE